ncbi:hypothetical protein [Nocardiopsis sp. CNT312]|uniref:hypothetical protein n=1 Tax=Nocardiopsis sp. CNT312 TaxID=1137268 RepID=UPI00048E52F0|nr:hypothetical protein [Nocardiopsis sp. CNT312]
MTSCPFGTFQQSEPHPDPYAVYAGLRDEYGAVIPIELEPGVRAWILTDYELIISWSRDTVTFTHDPRTWEDFREGRIAPDSRLAVLMAPRPSALFTDGAEHQRYRGAIADALDAVQEGDVRAATRRYADGLIDTFCERGSADLYFEYARLLPLLVVNELFGLTEDQGLRFGQAINDLWTGGDLTRSVEESDRALSEAIAAKRVEPGDDLISRLLQHRSALTDEEVILQLRVVITIALHTTTDLIFSSTRLLLSDSPSHTGRALSDAVLGELLDRVLWEAPPITNYPALYPRTEVPLGGGRTIEAGTPILLGFAAANHFYRLENAALLEEAPSRAHLAWGVGPHRCPARDQALVIATVAVRTVLDRLPDLALASRPEDLRWLMTHVFCLPTGLAVRFTAREPAVRPDREPDASSSDAPSTVGDGSVLLKRLPSGPLARFLGRLLRRS